MSGMFRKRLQKAVVEGLTTACRLLDEIPAVGRDYEVLVPDEDDPVDDVIITAGGFRIYRQGGWGSRFTLLPFVSAELDARWGTGVWDVPVEEAAPADLAPVEPLPLRAVPEPSAWTTDRAVLRRRSVHRRLRTHRRSGSRAPSLNPV